MFALVHTLERGGLVLWRWLRFGRRWRTRRGHFRRRLRTRLLAGVYGSLVLALAGVRLAWRAAQRDFLARVLELAYPIVDLSFVVVQQLSFGGSSRNDQDQPARNRVLHQVLKAIEAFA